MTKTGKMREMYFSAWTEEPRVPKVKIFHCSHAGSEEVGTVNHKARNGMLMFKSR